MHILIESIINTLFLILISSFSIFIGFYLNLLKSFKFKSNTVYNNFYNKIYFYFLLNILLFFIPKYILMVITNNIYLTFILILLPYTFFIFSTNDHYVKLIQYFKIKNYSIFDKLIFLWTLFKPQILFSLFIVSAEVISDFTVTNYFSYFTITLKIFLDYQNYLSNFLVLEQIIVFLSFIFFVLNQINFKSEMDQKLIHFNIYFINKITLKNILIFLPAFFLVSYLLIFDYKFFNFIFYLIKNIYYQILFESDQILIQLHTFLISIFFASFFAILIILIKFLFKNLLANYQLRKVLYFFYFIPNIIFTIIGVYLHLGIFILIFLVLKFINLALIIDYYPKINNSFWSEIRQLSRLKIMKKFQLKIFILKNLWYHYKTILIYVFLLLFNEIIKEVPITMFSLSDKITLISFEIYNYINNEVYEKVSLLILLLSLISIFSGILLKFKRN